MRCLTILLLCLSLPVVAFCQSSADCVGQNADLDGDMLVGVSDIIEMLQVFGTVLDADLDGALDCGDGCVGEFDECGVCNGPGPTLQVLDSVIIIYDSLYVEAIDDYVVYELGADSVFSLRCNCVDPIVMDSYSYSTVLIGDQCWFAQNLRTTTYADGTIIPAGFVTIEEWMSNTSGATTVYGEDSFCSCYTSVCTDYYSPINACDEAQSLAEYGRLYNWFAVDDARGLCPSGWHVPTDDEWTELKDFISAQGFSGTEGAALKATYGYYQNANGTDDFGFTALPGGLRSPSNELPFGEAGRRGVWWSSTPSSDDDDEAWYYRVIDSNSLLSRIDTRQDTFFSVRCLQNAD